MNKILILLVVLFIASCDTLDKKSSLEGKWQAVDLDNPQLTALMGEQRNFLDTFGTHTTEEQNIELYKSSNVDSIRAVLLKEMDTYMSMQKEVINGTVFEFKKDGTAILNFNGDVDTSKWFIDDAGRLQLTDMKKQNAPDVEMEVLSLNDTSLKLKLLGQGANSTVIFKPVDK